MRDRAIHTLVGAAVALACIYLPASLLAVSMATLVGYVREAEQRPLKRWRPWSWSRHALLEWFAWPLGSLLGVLTWHLLT